MFWHRFYIGKINAWIFAINLELNLLNMDPLKSYLGGFPDPHWIKTNIWKQFFKIFSDRGET